MINLLNIAFDSPIIAAIAGIFIIVFLYFNRNLKYWEKIGVSGPKPIALFGNMHSYFLKPQPEVESEWYRKYGKIYGIFVGNTPLLEVAEPELIKQILVKDFHTFRNRRDADTNHQVMSKNLAVTVDDDWKRIRAIVSPTFSSGKLKKMYSLLKECNEEFMDSLDEYAKNGKNIDLKKVHGAYTLDVIAKCAFATNPNTYKDPDNNFTKHAINVFKITTWKMLLLFLIPEWLSKNPKFRNLFSNNISIEFFINVVKHLVNDRKLNGINKNADFLQLLIEAEKSENTSYETDSMAANHLNEGNDEIKANIESLKENNSKVSDKNLSENEILAQCLVFLLAGYETTATTLSFCSYELALHPEIQQKLYEEIKTAFDDKGDIEYDALFKLPYLDAVVSETLRKYPPAMRLARKAMNDIVLGDTGIKIPKGRSVEIPVYAIHNDPNNYENPQNFNPERFMPENRANIKPYTYLPFGTGPRNCIGMRFALLEAKLALFNIIKRFVFSKTSNTPNVLNFKRGRSLIQADKPFIIGITRR